MTNQDIQRAWDYHNRTKHSLESVRSNSHFLDWPNQPIPFKVYTDLEPRPLDPHLHSSSRPALHCLLRANEPQGEAVVSAATLAEVLFLCAGITRRRPYPGGEILFRAAACTGALYHIDVYIVCGLLPGLEGGVYHFAPDDFALRELRTGDFRSVLIEATETEASVAQAPAVLVFTSTFWRNSWKYQARTYRHCFWDNGTILANLLAACAARELPAKIVLGFRDAMVNSLLGLDTQKEVVLSLVSLGCTSASGAGLGPPLAPLSLRTKPLSPHEVDYPAIRTMHEASSLSTGPEVSAWREGYPAVPNPKTASQEYDRVHLPRPRLEKLPQTSIERTIMRRGSTRRFARTTISKENLSTVLASANLPIPVDFLRQGDPPLNDVYLIVNAVDGVSPGAYVFDRRDHSLVLLKKGLFRKEAGFLGLSQDIPADASADVFFLTDLGFALQRYGNRGYRAAQLEASVAAGRLYLAAYAQGLGASGLTFFDEDVTDFFSPHASGKSVMFLIALGRKADRKE